MEWNKVVDAQFKVLYWHLPGGTEENNKKISVRIASLQAKI
jgi:hypothetical protein